MKAPFAGVVPQVSIVPGSAASQASLAVRLINSHPLHVDLRLSEHDVAQVQVGQPVKFTIGSLAGWQTDGKVSYVAPAADTTNSGVTYIVRVSFPDNDPKVKIGMTADLEIIIAARQDVLLVPNTALAPKGSGWMVQGVTTDLLGKTTIESLDVQIGLSNGAQTEIVDGLSEGKEIVARPDNRMIRPAGGLLGR